MPCTNDVCQRAVSDLVSIRNYLGRPLYGNLPRASLKYIHHFISQISGAMCTRESEKNRQKLSRVADFCHFLTVQFIHGSDIIMFWIPHRYLSVIDSII